MTDDGGTRGVGPVTYNVNKILDAHTHLTGQENAEEILECMDFCGIDTVPTYVARPRIGCSVSAP
jgi:hypothetical protein